jgi:hypothetical protein
MITSAPRGFACACVSTSMNHQNLGTATHTGPRTKTRAGEKVAWKQPPKAFSASPTHPGLRACLPFHGLVTGRGSCRSAVVDGAWATGRTDAIRAISHARLRPAGRAGSAPQILVRRRRAWLLVREIAGARRRGCMHRWLDEKKLKGKTESR